MRFINSIFKYLGFFLLGAIFCTFIGITGASYYVIEQLTQAAAPEAADTKKSSPAKMKTSPQYASESSRTPHNLVNPNLKDLTKIGVNYVEELDLFDQLAAEISQRSVPDLCTTLCNPILIDPNRLSNERTSYLAFYYKQEGVRALEDPLFRLKLEEIGFLSELFPSSLRVVLAQIEKNAKTAEKSPHNLMLALQLELAILKEASSFGLRWDSMKQDTFKLKLVRNLVRSCQRGVPRNKVISECRSQLAGI